MTGSASTKSAGHRAPLSKITGWGEEPVGTNQYSSSPHPGEKMARATVVPPGAIRPIVFAAAVAMLTATPAGAQTVQPHEAGTRRWSWPWNAPVKARNDSGQAAHSQPNEEIPLLSRLFSSSQQTEWSWKPAPPSKSLKTTTPISRTAATSAVPPLVTAPAIDGALMASPPCLPFNDGYRRYVPADETSDEVFTMRDAVCERECTCTRKHRCRLIDGDCGHCCEDIPCFQPRPLGESFRGHFHVHRRRGDAARMVLYDYDFLPGSAELKPRGYRQLQKIAELLPQTFAPVLIEPTAHVPGLSEARRLTVIEALSAQAFPVPPERVRVQAPPTPGLPGDEALMIHDTFLRERGAPGQGPSTIGDGVPVAPPAGFAPFPF